MSKASDPSDNLVVPVGKIANSRSEGERKEESIRKVLSTAASKPQLWALVLCLALQLTTVEGQTQISFSDICVNSCLSSSQVYCPFNNHSSGYCIDSFEEGYQENVCSVNATGNSRLEIWSCPNEEFCGNPYIDVPQDESAQTFTLGEYSNLVQGKTCKYLIRFPAFFSGTYDTVNVTLHSSAKVSIDAMVGTYYNSSSVTQVTLDEGVPYPMTFPNQMFLLFQGQKIFRGNFSFSVQYVNNGGYKNSNTSYYLNNTGYDINANYEEYFYYEVVGIIDDNDNGGSSSSSSSVPTYYYPNTDDSSMDRSLILIIVLAGVLGISIILAITGLVIYQRKKRSFQVQILNKEKEFMPVEFAFTGSIHDKDQLDVYFEEFLFKKFNHPVYQPDLDDKAARAHKPTQEQEKFIAFKFSHHVEQQVQDEVNAPPIAKQNTSELDKELADLEEVQEVHDGRKKKKEIEVINPDTMDDHKPPKKEGELSQVPIAENQNLQELPAYGSSQKKRKAKKKKAKVYHQHPDDQLQDQVVLVPESYQLKEGLGQPSPLGMNPGSAKNSMMGAPVKTSINTQDAGDVGGAQHRHSLPPIVNQRFLKREIEVEDQEIQQIEKKVLNFYAQDAAAKPKKQKHEDVLIESGGEDDF